MSVRPSGEPVDAGEQIGLPSGGWQRSYQVDMNGIKPCESGEWCDGVPVDFGSLAVGAGLCPSSAVSADVGPDKSCLDEFLGCVDAWVGHRVE